jgi:hypothetical protein
MSNITLSIDDDLLEAGRRYAQEHNTSLNALVRELLAGKVTKSSDDWLTEAFLLMDRAKGDSKGKKWKRDDLYDV